ncbi:thiamine-phosphate kinase [Demequina sp. NBRC 110053]|uniref:thiamine-phosphate kinase n=1 Tax=Demequina sp. NBRC 110053 TaxID=1570342 RepID=UPI0009FD112F|nr:thiamine-phosphate kinase [Demequina sp. NBRC 110053]
MTTIGDMDEDSLIALFAPRLPRTDAEILGPGDDAAVVAVDGDLVVSCDVLVENRHFRSAWSTGADVGWRAAMQNLADIDAMGAVATSLEVTLCAPSTTPVQWVLDLADGLREACEPHGVGVVGGDLSGADEIVVAVTVLGETHGTEPVTRADAVAGDVIAVSGALGAAKAGFEQLARGERVDEEAVSLFLRPAPRIGAGLEGALHGATAMMDLSDGLTRDASRMARASEVTLEVRSDEVPVHPAALRTARALGLDASEALAWALSGGEDHHMLATFPRASAVPGTWHVVGVVREGDGELLIDGARPRGTGWDHFA